MQDNATRPRLLHPADCNPGELYRVGEVDVKQFVMGRLVSVVPKAWARCFIYTGASNDDLWDSAELAMEGFEGCLKLLPIGDIHSQESNPWSLTILRFLQPRFCLFVQAKVADQDRYTS